MKIKKRPLKNRVNRYYFEAGMDSMMEELEPEVVLVYSKMPDEIKEKYLKTQFVEYEDWASIVRKTNGGHGRTGLNNDPWEE